MTPRVIAARVLALLLASTWCGAPVLAEDVRPEGIADEHVLLRTNYGDLVLALFPRLAPRHVEQVLRLTRAGVYDSTPFRIARPDFVLQLEHWPSRTHPLTEEQRGQIVRLPAEFSELPHRPGVLSMARYDDDPNSAETSFSILLDYAPHLDRGYTVFGELEWGWPTIHAMLQVARDSEYHPLAPITIERALVVSSAEIRDMHAKGLLRGPPAETPRTAPARAVNAIPLKPTLTCLALLVLLAAAGYLAAVRGANRTAAAMNLLIVAVAGFWALMTLTPFAKTQPVVSIALLFGVLALFKFMNRFEIRLPAPLKPDRRHLGEANDAAGRRA